MKRIYTLSLSIFAIILLSGCANQKIKNNTVENGVFSQQSKIELKTKEYYENFRKKCEGSGCCLSSVNNAEQDNSLIYEELMKDVICPEGFTPNALKCPDSYKWCSPITKNSPK
jgi:hypothetical protein